MTDLLSLVNVKPDDPEFYLQTFRLAAKNRQKKDSLEEAIGEEYIELSEKLDSTKIQESCSVRNVLRTRTLANLLIDDAGHLREHLVAKAIDHLKKHLYSLGPERQFDAKRQEQILQALMRLDQDKKMLLAIKKPYHHPFADQMIRYTLELSSKITLTDAHARRAVLSAWMCYLRQNVGSCFATAPAIIVHDEQPHQFLTDLNEILGTGRLKRTFGGVEYSVPLSASWGKGDLRKPVVVERIKEEIYPKLWEAPGLIQAFEAAEIDLTKEKMLKVLQTVKAPIFIVYAEVLIKKIILQELKISEQELADYERRPKAMMQAGLMMQPGQKSEKGKQISLYYTKFEDAVNAFKSLAENALLKVWEFSLASFAETKAEFTRWNLYSSLGLKPDEYGGIGNCIYQFLQGKLERYNAKVRNLQQEYEQIFAQVKYLEGRMRRAATEDELKFLKVEYRMRTNEFYSVEEMRNDANEKAHKIAGLYDALMEHYFRLFPHYFQEVYDADMQDVESGPFDDSPAGFRLLYKYGRANTSQWTLIHSPDEFVEALAAFFIATETEISSSEEFQSFEDDLSQIVTAIVNHVKTREFLETAFHRMARAHKMQPIADPLENLDKIKKKPWVYISGGAMGSLVSCYFMREDKPTEMSRWVENPMELLVFLVDTMKQVPPKIMQNFYQNPKMSFLMHSPTHAFLLKPKIQPFMDACLTQEFSYTWIRDQLIDPMQNFIYQLRLDEDMIDYVLERLKKRVPDQFKHYFSRRMLINLYGNMTPKEFRNQLLEHFQRDPNLSSLKQTLLPAEEIDSLLYSLLPLFRSSDLKQRLTDIFSELKFSTTLIDSVCESVGNYRMMDAEMLRNLVMGMICLELHQTSTSINYHLAAVQAARKHGYAMPQPIIFADTNWVKDYFAFVVSPSTGELELWRVDATGAEGAPMLDWVQWLNGSVKQPDWGIYTNVFEYTL